MLNFNFYISFFLAAFTYCHVESADLPQHRNVIRDRNKLWEHGTVVYQYNSLLDDSQKAIIKGAMDEIQKDVSVRGVGCIDFQERQGAYLFRPDFLYIQPATDGECRTDSVGMSGGRQRLYVADSCLTHSRLIPFLLSILGLYHEHRRPDRDLYIQVFENNVKNDYRPTFQKLAPTDTDLLQFPYDFDSITHYGPYAYAIDPHAPTISSIQPDVSFGNKRSLSFHDVLKVQILYVCGHDTSHIANSPALAVDCNFENILCNLADDYLDDFKWIRQNSPLPSGPSADHSNGAGYYLYANGTDHFNKTARLLSAREIPPGEYCISMLYFIVGDNTGYLRVKAYDYGYQNETTLSTKQVNSGNNKSGGWYEYETPYTNNDNRWRVHIECYISDESGGVAIDDVQIYPGVCA